MGVISSDDLCQNCRGEAIFIRYCELCRTCYNRWAKDGRQTWFDGSPKVPIVNRKKAISDARYEDFVELCENGYFNAPVRVLMERLGVARRTITRYRARLRDEQIAAQR
jgi:hypothetical protein